LEVGNMPGITINPWLIDEIWLYFMQCWYEYKIAEFHLKMPTLLAELCNISFSLASRSREITPPQFSEVAN